MLTPPPIRKRNPLLYFLVALALAVAAVAVWFSVAWLTAASDRSAANTSLASANAELDRARQTSAGDSAKTRNDATKAGRAGVAIVNTVDYRDVDASLDRWEQVSTGQLHDDVAGGRAQTKQALEQAKTSATASVLAAAVTELNDQAGTATMIAAVKVTVTADGKPPVDKYTRLRAGLQRTKDGWKLRELGQVDVATR